MNPYLSKSSVLPVLLTLLLLGALPVAAQTDQPEWAEDLLAEFEERVADYNEAIETETVPLPVEFLLRNERVNLYVAAEGEEAAYSFVTDGDLRIADLRAGARDDATIQVRTTRALLVHLVDETDDPVAVLSDALVTGEVSVARIVTVFGTTVVVGVPEAAAGLVGVVAGAAVAAKVGVGGLVSASKAVGARLVAGGRWLLRALLRALATLWGSLSEIATTITVLEALGVRVKDRVRALWGVLTAPLVRVRAALGRRRLPPDESSADEHRKRDGSDENERV